MTKQAKVLIFDSGVGGLSIYKEIHLRLPHLEYVYLFDNEAYPYGELAPEILITRVGKLIDKMVKLEQIDLVVIACNTASTIVLPHLRHLLTIPIVGVVPAIKPAAVISKQAIALIATPGTVAREYTHQLIQQFAKNIPVERLGTTRLVTIAEEKLRGIPVCQVELQEILTPLINKIDVAVLGCTHFPLLSSEIQKVLGEKVTLVDSGCAISERVESLLKERSLSAVSARMIKKEKMFGVYSSATPFDGVALNIELAKLGFSPVQRFQLLDA